MTYYEKRDALIAALDMLNHSVAISDQEWYDTTEKLASILFNRILSESCPSGTLTKDEWKLLDDGDKIGCIKLVRTRTGMMLKEAKRG